MLSSRNNHQAARNHEREFARYQEVMKLRKQGASILGVAQTLKMSRMTVYRYLRSDSFPERARGKKRRSALEPYLTYIHQRFAAGCDNATQLWREVVARGYTGKPAMVRRYVRRLRVRVRRMPETEKQLRLKNSFATPSPKRTAHWLLKEEKELEEEERLFINELLCDSPDIKRVGDPGRRFQRMTKERDEKPFAKWLTETLQSGIKGMAGFADGLKKDLNAVTEALGSKWSNGQTEGQINRLKYLKRQMYGRAKLELLKARVLYAA
jgi:transposase